jgi:hypothetical protein
VADEEENILGAKPTKLSNTTPLILASQMVSVIKDLKKSVDFIDEEVLNLTDQVDCQNDKIISTLEKITQEYLEKLR